MRLIKHSSMRSKSMKQPQFLQIVSSALRDNKMEVMRLPAISTAGRDIYHYLGAVIREGPAGHGQQQPQRAHPAQRQQRVGQRKVGHARCCHSRAHDARTAPAIVHVCPSE